MGRKNKTYYKDLHQQAYDRLTEMLAFGESKKEAVAAGTEKDKIFSVNTYKSYWKHIKYFLRYIKQKHPECTTLKGAKKYVNEWLQSRADEELSAWTVQLEAKALGKLYGIEPDDEDYFKPPKRNREDIKRSRSDCVRDEHFSKTNNDELIKFCRGTGLRRRELGAIVFAPGAEDKRRLLNRITHRYVCSAAEAWLRECSARGERFAVIDAPMLFESGLNERCDTVVFVTADRQTRTDRIMRGSRPGAYRRAA